MAIETEINRIRLRSNSTIVAVEDQLIVDDDTRYHEDTVSPYDKLPCHLNSDSANGIDHWQYLFSNETDIPEIEESKDKRLMPKHKLSLHHIFVGESIPAPWFQVSPETNANKTCFENIRMKEADLKFVKISFLCWRSRPKVDQS